MEYKEEISVWLVKEKGFGKKSSSDIVSRVKRALCEFEIETDDYVQNILYKLEQNKNFKLLSVSVRSQIKRAIKLYKEYFDSL